MTSIEILLTAFSLSLDAVAIAAAAAAVTRISAFQALKIAFFFGAFQLVMPVIGWLLGASIYEYALAYGHVIGFVLLLGVGLKMLHEATRKEDDEDELREKHLAQTYALTIMAIATSIDALVVGITFSFIDVNILIAVSTIGVVTFVLSLVAIQFGRFIQRYAGNNIEYVGGIVLIALAFKTLLF
jgi:manganese efflux pump family protein